MRVLVVEDEKEIADGLLSMLPLCIPHGGSEDAMKGMALVIIGGLTASTILTFFLLPTFYMTINKKDAEPVKVTCQPNSEPDGFIDLDETEEPEELPEPEEADDPDKYDESVDADERKDINNPVEPEE